MVKNILDEILSYSMLLGAVYFFIFPLQSKYIPLAFIGSFIFSKLVNKIIIDKYNLKSIYKTLILIALWVNLLGEVVLYGMIFYLDKAQHFTVTILVTSMFYDYLKNNKIKASNFLVFFAVMGTLAIWEIFDYILFYYFGFDIMGVYIRGILVVPPLNDTIWDMIAGGLGAGLSIIYNIKRDKH